VTLERQAGGQTSVWVRQRLALAALGLAVATVVAAFVLLLSGGGLFTTEIDVRFLIPSASVAGLLAVASLLKGEGTIAIPLAAIATAAAGLVLGWVVVVGLVVLGTALLIGILSLLM
jgi:hypothetical protein